MLQMYWYVPDFIGAVNILVWFWVMLPVLNPPEPAAVKVWVAESLLVTAMVAPGLTVNVIGLNMKFEMVIDDPNGEPLEPDEPGMPESLPPPKARTSRAPATTRTPSPTRIRRSIWSYAA